MRVLVCGSRSITAPAPIEAVLFGLSSIRGEDPDFVVIEGGARGADTIARQWCEAFDEDFEEYPADWDRYGKRAGYIRNRQMLDEGKPDLVVAFYDGRERSKGTAMMCDLARRAGVEVWEVFIDRLAETPQEPPESRYQYRAITREAKTSALVRELRSGPSISSGQRRTIERAKS